MKLEVGKKYKNRRGEIITLVRWVVDSNYPYRDGDNRSYMQNGKWETKDCEYDLELIEEVVDTPKFEVGEEVEVIPKTDAGYYWNGTIVGFWDNAVWVHDQKLNKGTAFKIDLNRIKKLPPKMTKEEAEQKYNIRIV